jgi:ABC-type branched-subunit amino acid transport system substrate-binding protein
VRPMTVLASVVAIGLLATGCSSSRDDSSTRGAATPSGGGAQATGDFGDLKGICGKGSPSGSPAQGVTASEIQVGTMTDLGFTQNSEYVDAAKVFTSWCNDAGGINGRKLVSETRDAALLNARQQVLASCRSDFALVGGSNAFDGLGVADRLKCLEPAFPAQVVQGPNVSSDLQVQQTGGNSYNRFAGFWQWLVKEAYPDSAAHVGFLNGDSPITKSLTASGSEGMAAAGGTVTYNEFYPLTGVTDWTPYAQALKTKGVKGLVFYGDFRDLAKVEQALTTIGYKLDWIDANSNSYGPAFPALLGPALTAQNNLADISGTFPLENASENPATQQVLDLYQKYLPAAKPTMPAIHAFSAWALFAKAATSCGNELTRKCALEAAQKESAWTGGGLIAPVDLTSTDVPLKCFNAEKVTPNGWEPADFKPNQGAYRCDFQPHKYTGNYPKSLTLADVGKSMADFK